VLLPLMDWLERRKGELAGNEAITNEVVASAHIENHAMKLFLWADKEDREARFNKAGSSSWSLLGCFILCYLYPEQVSYMLKLFSWMLCNILAVLAVFCAS
jgi:hypothetical protein